MNSRTIVIISVLLSVFLLFILFMPHDKNIYCDKEENWRIKQLNFRGIVTKKNLYCSKHFFIIGLQNELDTQDTIKYADYDLGYGFSCLYDSIEIGDYIIKIENSTEFILQKDTMNNKIYKMNCEHECSCSNTL